MVYEAGMLVKSKAGRDKDSVYVIVSAESEYVYVADGACRPVCRPKKKNKKHLQTILKERLDAPFHDGDVRELCRRIRNVKG